MNSATPASANQSRLSPPPVIETSGDWNKTLILLVVIATVVLLALYAFVDPSRQGFFPRCVFHQITGLNCPGCGGQRALHHLLHGDVAGALRLNLLFVALVPFGCWAALRWSLKVFAGKNLPALFSGARWLWALVIVVIAFGVIRNLPGFSWLSP